MTSPPLDEEALADATNKVAEGLYYGQPQVAPGLTPKGLAGDIAREAVRAYLSARAELGFREMPREPTQEMDLAGTRSLLGGRAYSIGVWQSMFDQHAKDSQ